MNKEIILLLTSCLLLTWIEVIAVNSVGVIIASRGQVSAKNEQGVTRALQRRSEVYLHETITTQENSEAQLRLNDGTLISIKPDTRYSVSEFNLDAKNPKNNRYTGKLMEGVLISLSGQGKNTTHNNHLLKTPVTTIAIRGTFFESGVQFNEQINEQNNPKELQKVRFGSDQKHVISTNWTNVRSGQLGVESRSSVCNIDARDFKRNSCFCRIEGSLDQFGEFTPIPDIPITVVSMGEKQMREAVQTPTSSSVSSRTVSGDTTVSSSAPSASGTSSESSVTGETPISPTVEQGLTEMKSTVKSSEQIIEKKATPIPPKPGYTPPPEPDKL